MNILYKNDPGLEAMRQQRLKATKERRTLLAQKQKEIRLCRKKYGICVRCGQNDAVEGLTICQTCREKHNAQRRKKDKKPVIKKTKKYKPLSKEEMAKKVDDNRKRREERSANGLCTMCGKEKALPGLKTCSDCRIRYNQARSGYVNHTQKWYEKERELGRLL